MSKPVDLDKLRSINIGGATAGKSRIKTLRDDDTGRATGFEVDHGDRQEAIVRPQTIRATMSVSTGKIRNAEDQ